MASHRRRRSLPGGNVSKNRVRFLETSRVNLLEEKGLFKKIESFLLRCISVRPNTTTSDGFLMIFLGSCLRIFRYHKFIKCVPILLYIFELFIQYFSEWTHNLIF